MVEGRRSVVWRPTRRLARRAAGIALIASLAATGCAPAPAVDASADTTAPVERASVLPASGTAPSVLDAGASSSDPAPGSVLARPAALHGSSVERVARQMTVRLRARGCGRLGTASAVAVGPQLLVTNRHAVEGAAHLELNYWDGTSARAQVTGLAVADDLALVSVSSRLPAVASLAPANASDDAPILVAGYPSGEEQEVVRGSVVEYARLREPDDASPVMRMTTRIVPGNSGGAVVDATGDLVGIVFGVETATGYGLAVPASAVAELLRSGGTPGSSRCS